MAKKIFILIGTRPNFIKVTQFKKEAAKFPGLEVKLIHTGQHYDEKLADVFFEQFSLQPDFFLHISASSANNQIAEIMISFEKLIISEKPDLILVVGDVNSTLAGAISANKSGIKLGHIESGLRSFDKSMPEEFNRIIADHLSDYFFVTEQSGYDNLIREGKSPENIFFVGNTMIDTLVAFDEEVQKNSILKQLDLIAGEFVLMTMHRPATVDSSNSLNKLMELIEMICHNYKLVFPVHPRTINKLKEFGLYERVKNINGLILTDALDYFSFQKLIVDCKLILTDSGGIQEESTFRQKPCLTLRPNTERPSTVEIGTNTLVPFDLEIIKTLIGQIKDGTYKRGSIPPLWNGNATERIVKILAEEILR